MHWRRQMNSIILYESKKGCTKKCADYVKKEHQVDEMYRLNDFNGNIEDYDHIILMTPTYIGQINKKMKEFLSKYQKALLEKKLTIVIIGMNVKEYDKMLELNLSKDILDHAEVVYGGGAYYFEKLNFFQKAIIKKVAGVSKSLEDIKYDKLQKIKI